jgi:alpha-tubulin suppressor-like RCC1 family protein
MWHYNGWAIDSSGNLYTWWTNGQWQLGVWDTGSNSTYGTSLYYNTPKNRNSITDAKEICFGQYHAILIKNDGTAYSWWSNSLWRLWNGSSSTNSYSPYKLPISNAIWCSADDYWSSVITSLWKVYYFWSNNFWEMWTGNTNDVHTPTATSLNNVIDTALQFDSSHALVNGMIVYWFWYNWNWELGIGTSSSTTTITSWNFTIPPIVMEVK